MSERVTMPALGESVTEGTVTRWLKSVGDSVEVDEPLLEVSTDKVDTEIPSPAAGTLQEILVEEDETVEVGADLAVIGDGDAPAKDDSGDEDQSAAEEAKDSESSQPETEETVEETTQAAPSTEQEEPADESDSGDTSGSGSGGSSGGSVSGGDKVTMPALGESVTEGTITRWLKAEGDDVEVDEPLLEVSTDKVDTEIPSPFAGKLTKILVQEDETAEVGAELAIVGGEASGGDSSDGDGSEGQSPKEDAPKEEAPKEEAPKEEAKAEEKPKEQPKQDAPQQQSSEPKAAAPRAESQGDADASAYVTPLVRKLAADNGVDLSSLKGTGVGGRIRKQDVLDAAKEASEPEAAPAAAATPAAAPAPAAGGGAPTAVPTADPASAAKRGTTEKMPRLRKVIAQRMVESLSVSAQLTAAIEVDMTRVVSLRARAKGEFQQREGVKLTYLPFITLAAIEALKAFPQLNSSIDGDSLVYHGAEHVGIAVDTERGLLVPVIKDAGDLNIAGLSRKIADLADRTRTNKVGPDELGGATFTITNIGSNGSLLDTPIINQPNVGILGTGAIVKRPAVVTDAEGNDAIAIRSMMYLVLTYDHRAVDGALAGKFLSALKARLEEGRFESSLGL
ncbi:2-oxoglutarate dehydrogenase, E2 component, dihydrolipoamide succinyltransferase [Arsenicicoccus sp. UBA7492]|uniref:2-oxoglutarate dehydrogenase, E2 component, dihydrolipoamide succinyltransferase n=2 Tax=Arsenicicoccus TaxID=267408 RepID=UPI00257E31AE|nr:2-oxoglutarate dehydrogenase, E2 component, dihydrolipoamide succinyltransferase [Arsenicicoccus sp. UBA7492]